MLKNTTIALLLLAVLALAPAVALAQDDPAPDTEAPRARPWTGLGLAEVDDALRRLAGVDDGVLVERVVDGSPAAEAGIQRYDIITAVDGTITDSVARFDEVVADQDAGDTLTLAVVRERAQIELELVLGARSGLRDLLERAFGEAEGLEDPEPESGGGLFDGLEGMNPFGGDLDLEDLLDGDLDLEDLLDGLGGLFGGGADDEEGEGGGLMEQLLEQLGGLFGGGDEGDEDEGTGGLMEQLMDQLRDMFGGEGGDGNSPFGNPFGGGASSDDADGDQADAEPHLEPWLGFGGRTASEALRALGVEGVEITRITSGGPAADADLREGDIIVRLDGEPVADKADLLELTATVEAGQRLLFTVIREGQEIDRELTVGERAAEDD